MPLTAEPKDYLLFFSHPPQFRWYGRIARELRRRLDVSMHLWVMGASSCREARAGGDFDNVVDVLEGFDSAGARAQEAENLALLAEFEREHGGAFFHQAVIADRHLASRGWPNSRCAHYAVHLLLNMKEALGQAGQLPVACFGENNTLAYRLAHRLIRDEVPYWHFSVVRLWDHRFFLDEWQSEQWQECRSLYLKFRAGGIPQPLRQVAVQRWQAIRDGLWRPHYFLQAPRGDGGVLERLQRDRWGGSLARWAEELFSEESRINPERSGPWLTNPLLRAGHVLRQSWRKRFLDRCGRISPPKDKFCTYFLHMQPEHSVEGLAFEHRDQKTLIANIAAVLPADVRLVVKEHKGNAGLRPIGYYRELQRVRNIVLASDRADTAALIRSSKIVFTLSGTVALEAMCLGVPAIVFADIFFEGFEGIFKVRSFAELRDTVDAILGSSKTGATVESAQAAVAAIYAASHPGAIGAAYSLEQMTAEQNIAAIGQATEDAIRQLLNRTAVDTLSSSDRARLSQVSHTASRE